MKNLLLISLLMASTVQAATVTVDLPTNRKNGDTLDPSEITEIIIYRNGELYGSYDPETSSIAVEDTCQSGVVWTGHAIDNEVPGIISDPAPQPRDEVGCAPKKLGLSVSSTGS